MSDIIAGYLEVGDNGQGEVVINYRDLTPDENGVGYIVFSPGQARNLGNLLIKRADSIEIEAAYAKGLAGTPPSSAVRLAIPGVGGVMFAAGYIFVDGREASPGECDAIADYLMRKKAESPKGNQE